MNTKTKNYCENVIVFIVDVVAVVVDVVAVVVGVLVVVLAGVGHDPVEDGLLLLQLPLLVVLLGGQLDQVSLCHLE